MGLQAPEQLGVVEHARAHRLDGEPGEARIGVVEPAAEGDAVGLVDDLVRIQRVQVGEDRGAHQVGVQRRDAVDPARAVEGEVPHPHPAAVRLVDQRDRGEVGGGIRRSLPAVLGLLLKVHPVDQVDDLHVARQQPLHQLHRPGLQGLGQEGVVGVVQRVGGDVPRILPGEAVPVEEEAHQLRHRDGRVRVVELDRGVVRQGPDVAALGHVPGDEILDRRRREEVFLAQAQLLPLGRGIARIEHAGDRLGAHPRRHRADMVAAVEPGEVHGFAGLGLPQAQGVHVAPAPADHRHVVGHRPHGLGRLPVPADHPRLRGGHGDGPAEADGVGRLGPGEFPGVALGEPRLRRLALPAVLEGLAEQAVVVADPVAHGRDADARHALHEAGGEPPEAAVAQSGVGLGLLHGVEVDPEFPQGGAGGLGQAEVVHRVRHQPADQEFQRQVVDALVRDAALGRHAGRHDPLAQGQRGRGEPVARAGGLGRAAEGEGELGADRFPQVHHGVAASGQRRGGPGGSGRSLGNALVARDILWHWPGQNIVQHVRVPQSRRPGF